ncbi:MAG TPA: universal stress protein [Phenylobacterium sp.]|uniref:universal stress protein n=1 Tax=Phenylobacterium sp. TaxID=1871053 RepID=UPI002B4949A9|nr:universal stress protein [Phenylobacterium sp.]HKR89841.1 universal stress protein [Phenylobacterium sp.]
MLIVHPTDLLAVSEGAFDHALKLALAERGRLALVHAHTYAAEEIPELSDFPHVRDTLTRWGLLPPGAPQSDVGEKLGLQVSKGEIRAVDPEAALAKLVNDHGADMIVLGTRALEGLERLRKGSFSQALAREAKRPALFVPKDAEGFVNGQDGAVRLKNVLIPVDDDPEPAAAIAVARGLSRTLGQETRFHLLHVGQAMPPHGAKEVNEIVRSGPVVETIVEVADEVRADLIVMATAGHKSFLDAIRGSTTEEVLVKAKRALLAVPAV